MDDKSRLLWDSSVLNEVAGNLRDEGFEVEVAPRVGTIRPDLIVHDSDGHQYVVEVKAGSAAEHFGSVVDVGRHRDAAKAFRHKDDVSGLLITAGTEPGDLAQVGMDFSVDVLGTSSSDASAIASTIAQGVKAGRIG